MMPWHWSTMAALAAKGVALVHRVATLTAKGVAWAPQGGSVGCLRGGIGPTGWQHWLLKVWHWPHRVAALAV
jgi:hypothetical protein